MDHEVDAVLLVAYSLALPLQRYPSNPHLQHPISSSMELVKFCNKSQPDVRQVFVVLHHMPADSAARVTLDPLTPKTHSNPKLLSQHRICSCPQVLRLQTLRRPATLHEIHCTQTHTPR
jgi:hypothetical protein